MLGIPDLESIQGSLTARNTIGLHFVTRQFQLLKIREIFINLERFQRMRRFFSYCFQICRLYFNTKCFPH